MRASQWCAAFAAAALLAGCGRSEPREIVNAFQWTDQIPPGATLHLRDLNGSVRVVPTSGATTTVIGSKKWTRGRESDVRFVANRVGQDVYVCALWGSRSRCDEGGYSGGGGSILSIFSLRHHSTDMAANFAVQLPAGVNVDVTMVNGSASLEGLASDVRAQMVNGSITAHNTSGALHLETVNGSITAGVDSLTGADPLEFGAVNGSIHVVLPSTLQGDVSLETVTGRVSSDFPLQASETRAVHSMRGTLGGGGRTVSLKSVNGAVELLRKG